MRGKSGWLSKSAWIVLTAILVYVAVLGSLSTRRYDSYQADMYDLGIIEQTIWNTSQGRILTESVNNGYPTSRIWNGRWELVYFPISAIHRLFPHPYTALLFQTIVLALGAIPLYMLARYKLGEGSLAAAIPIAYLLYPALHNANLFDIHGIAMAAPMVLFSFYFIEKREKRLTCLFILFLLFCREDATFVAFMLGLYAWLIVGERRTGWTVMAMSVSWFFLSQNFVRLRPLLDLPMMSDPNIYPSRWEDVGGSSPVTFALTVFRDPIGFLQLFWKVEILKYLIKLLSPVGFLSLLSPASLVMMVPNMVVNIVTGSPTTRDIYHQYTGAITPVVFISLTIGSRNLLHYLRRPHTSGMLLRVGRFLQPATLSAIVLLSSATAMMLWSRVPDVASLEVTPHHESIERFVARIPPDVSVSAHSLIGPHVAHREHLYLFPDGVGEAEYIVYDLVLPYNRLMSHRTWRNPLVVPITDKPFRDLLNDRRYGIVEVDNGTILFRRQADYETGLEKFATLSLDRPAIVPRDIDIGTMKLVGIEDAGISGDYSWYKHLVLYWRWKGNGRAGSFPLTLAIQGTNHRRQVIHDPLFGKLLDISWKEGAVIRDDAYLPITEIEPGSYEVYLTIDGKESGETESEFLVSIDIAPDDLVSK